MFICKVQYQERARNSLGWPFSGTMFIIGGSITFCIVLEIYVCCIKLYDVVN